MQRNYFENLELLIHKHKERKMYKSIQEFYAKKREEEERKQQQRQEVKKMALMCLYDVLSWDKSVFTKIITTKGGIKERIEGLVFQDYLKFIGKYLALPAAICTIMPGYVSFVWACTFLLFIASWIAAFAPDPYAPAAEVQPQETSPPFDPVLSLLPDPPGGAYERSGQGYARMIPNAFAHVGLVPDAKLVDIVDVTDGPAAARVVVALPPGLRLSKVESAAHDLQAALGAPSLQVAAGPRANTAALIATHRRKQPVVLKQVVSSPEFQNLREKGGLPVPVGVNEVGEPVLTDLNNVVHILVGGSAGSGKSWWLNQFLVSQLLYQGPDKLRLVLIDPKRVEFTRYYSFPHVLATGCTPEDAIRILGALTAEMQHRYQLLEQKGLQNLRDWQGNDVPPIIICLIDEFAQLVSEKETSDDIFNFVQQIAQLARACGIHLVVATQRPSVDVLPGRIKVNFPTRVVFRMMSDGDLKTILDGDPGVTLTGKGDGLALLEGELGLIRFQGPGVGTSNPQVMATIEKLQQYWAEKPIPPAPCPAFEAALASGPPPKEEKGGKRKKKSEENPTPPPSTGAGRPENDDKVEINDSVFDDGEWEDTGSPTSADDDDPKTAIRRILARRALQDGEKTVPPVAELARQVGKQKAVVVAAIQELEKELFITQPFREGKTTRRYVIAADEELQKWNY